MGCCHTKLQQEVALLTLQQLRTLCICWFDLFEWVLQAVVHTHLLKPTQSSPEEGIATRPILSQASGVRVVSHELPGTARSPGKDFII